MLCELLAVHVLELSLNEFNGVIVLELAHEEDRKVQHLLHLHSVDLVLVLLLLQLRDHRREAQVHESLHAL